MENKHWNLNILVIDEDTLNHVMVSHVLEDKGINVHKCLSVKDLPSVLKEDISFDLILFDPHLFNIEESLMRRLILDHNSIVMTHAYFYPHPLLNELPKIYKPYDASLLREMVEMVLVDVRNNDN